MERKSRYRSCAVLILTCLILSPAFTIAQDEQQFAMIPVSEEAHYTMTQFFQYDKKIPLDAKVIETKELSDCIREKIVFSGSHDGRVPGYIALPKSGTTPYPCILLLHGHGVGGKSTWWPDDTTVAITQSLLSSGFALLALDALYEGERANSDYFESPLELFCPMLCLNPGLIRLALHQPLRLDARVILGSESNS